MRDGFTLIELLVVLAVMTLIMGVVVPQGAKMLNRYSKKLDTIEQKQKLSKLQASSFLEVKEQNLTVAQTVYIITKKGVVFEIRNDNH